MNDGTQTETSLGGDGIVQPLHSMDEQPGAEDGQESTPEPKPKAKPKPAPKPQDGPGEPEDDGDEGEEPEDGPEDDEGGDDDDVEDTLDDLDGDDDDADDGDGGDGADQQDIEVGGKKYTHNQLEQLVSNGTNYEAKQAHVANAYKEMQGAEARSDATSAALRGVLGILDQQLGGSRANLEQAMRGAKDPAEQLRLQQGLKQVDDLEQSIVSIVQGATPEALEKAVAEALGDEGGGDGPVARAFHLAPRAALADSAGLERYKSRRHTKATLKSMYGLMRERYGMSPTAAKERLATASAEDLFMFSDILSGVEGRAKSKAPRPSAKPKARNAGKGAGTGRNARSRIASPKTMEKRTKYADEHLTHLTEAEAQEYIMTGRMPSGG